MTDDNIDDLKAENERLLAENQRLLGEAARITVSKETGVWPGLLANANNIDEARSLAADYLQWAADDAAPQPQSAPTPPTGAATYGTINGVSQSSRETLALLSPEQIRQAQAQGRLVGLGVGVEHRDRRNGVPW